MSIDDLPENTGAEVATTAVDTPLTEAPGAETTTADERLFTQAELDAIVAKRLVKQKLALERRTVTQNAPLPIADVRLDPTGFNTTEEYVDALASKKAEVTLEQRQQAAQNAEVQAKFDTQIDEAIEKYDDFTQVAFNPDLKVSTDMAEVIKQSDMGTEVLYYLGKNPEESARIAALTPAMQAKELGKIEAKMTSPVDPVNLTRAPSPISPVSSRSVTKPRYDTTDPRSIKEMSTSEWIAADRKRQIERMKAR